MSQTLDQFIAKYSAVQHLVKNLKANMDVYLDDWPESEKDKFLRMNMIMIRQCLEDFGAE
jgi:hypothetical protein